MNVMGYKTSPLVDFLIVGLLVIISVCVFVFAGCCSQKVTYGTVYVNYPQVFTRERLVIAREQEIQFLNSKLNTPVQSTIGGSRELRLLSAFQNSLGLTLSPTPTRGAGTPQLTDLSNLQSVAMAPQPTATNVTISAIDHFNDEMAYREAVNAVLREKQLDDMHDRRGKTLYTNPQTCEGDADLPHCRQRPGGGRIYSELPARHAMGLSAAGNPSDRQTCGRPTRRRDEIRERESRARARLVGPGFIACASGLLNPANLPVSGVEQAKELLRIAAGQKGH